MNEFTQSFQNLIHVLESEIKIYRDILGLVRTEKEFLVNSDLIQINENNRAKEVMILKIRGLEKQREKWTRELALCLDINKEQIKISDLLLKINGEKAEKLRQCFVSLELLIKRIQEYNIENEKMIQAALNNIKGTIDQINENKNASNITYKEKGKLEKKSLSGNIISKEV